MGETGPGGGKVFYDAGTTQSWGRYLEAAPTDYQVNGVSTTVGWGCASIPTGATASTGQANTDKILEKCNNLEIAADVAKKYSTSTAGAGQWFLPSLVELYKMWVERAAIGGFADGRYWSSSETGAWDAWYQNFGFGSYAYEGKYFAYYVRPVRAF